MIETEPIVDLNARYGIVKASKLLDVDPATLIRWTNKGLITCGVRKVNGHRYWTGKELLRAWKSSM